jgi:hypothetical protein
LKEKLALPVAGSAIWKKGGKSILSGRGAERLLY